jgi:hypothetical protein
MGLEQSYLKQINPTADWGDPELSNPKQSNAEISTSL